MFFSYGDATVYTRSNYVKPAIFNRKVSAIIKKWLGYDIGRVIWISLRIYPYGGWLTWVRMDERGHWINGYEEKQIFYIKFLLKPTRFITNVYYNSLVKFK